MTGIVLINTSETASALPLATSAVLKAFRSAWVGPNTKPFQLLALLIDLIGHQLYQNRKLVSFFRGFRFTAFGVSCNDRAWPHNKVVKLVRCAHWTAVHLHMCGFASQNSTTHMQTHSRRLPRR